MENCNVYVYRCETFNSWYILITRHPKIMEHKFPSKNGNFGRGYYFSGKKVPRIVFVAPSGYITTFLAEILRNDFVIPIGVMEDQIYQSLVLCWNMCVVSILEVNQYLHEWEKKKYCLNDKNLTVNI